MSNYYEPVPESEVIKERLSENGIPEGWLYVEHPIEMCLRPVSKPGEVRWVKASDGLQDPEVSPYMICRIPNAPNQKYRFVVVYNSTLKSWNLDLERDYPNLEWLDESTPAAGSDAIDFLSLTEDYCNNINPKHSSLDLVRYGYQIAGGNGGFLAILEENYEVAKRGNSEEMFPGMNAKEACLELYQDFIMLYKKHMGKSKATAGKGEGINIEKLFISVMTESETRMITRKPIWSRTHECIIAAQSVIDVLIEQVLPSIKTLDDLNKLIALYKERRPSV